MRINYFILSEKRMYSDAIKMMLDEIKKPSTIYDVMADLRADLATPTNGTVIIIGPHTAQDPYELCQDLSRTYPLTAVILLLQQKEIDFKKAMFVGAVDVLDIECEESEVIDSIQRAEKVVQQKVELDESSKNKKEAKIITVCSTKGGVGKTTISVNLAASLSKHNVRVALVDLDLQFGDVALLLDQSIDHSIYDWVKLSYENGDKSYSKFMMRTKAGVDILAAPDLPEFAELITGEHISYLLDVLKQDYDYIVIDTPPAFVETSLVALENSDTILLVASLDLPALKNGKLAVETLGVLGLKEKIKVILNRDSEFEGMTKEVIEDVLGLPISGRIPSDYRTVISSINNGEPFVLKASRTPVAKAVLKICEQVIDSFPKEKINKKKKKLSFFSRRIF
ncbi:AAA family ATPase [Bacillus sp. FJAT-45066]|uniref:AAA family ATPase n=1 Tax=Bacillus sp. FJAT-45066 TaxID=2011010 RepID=UPI000BB95FBC|nr:AAA family ATPase [Bacillus sp. FJAT-45066]